MEDFEQRFKEIANHSREALARENPEVLQSLENMSAMELWDKLAVHIFASVSAYDNGQPGAKEAFMDGVTTMRYLVSVINDFKSLKEEMEINPIIKTVQ